MARKQIIALCLFAAFLFPATAFAQVDPNALTQTEREKLGQLFTRAQQAFESEEYARAVAALESAYAIFPEPNILFRIGQAHEKSKQQALAIAYYKRYLKLKPQASDRELVEARIVGMQSLIDGRKPTKAIQTTLYIDSVPDNARVEFNNDGAVGRTPLLIEIKPGTYRVDITKDGYLPGTKEITVGAGEGLRVSLELSETPSTLPDSTWKQTTGFVGLGLGVVSLGVGAGFLFFGLDQQRQVDDYDSLRNAAFDAGERIPDRPSDYDQLFADAPKNTTIGFVGLGVGAVLTTASTILLFMHYGGTEKDDLAFDFQIRPDRVGAGLSLRF